MANTIIFERLFPIIVKRKLKNLQIDNESISYITTPATAKYITDIIFEYSKQCKFNIEKIIDCTGCVGGDTIALATAFKSAKIISIEIDKERCSILQNNIDVYELKNVNVIHNCCIDYIKKSDMSDVVYIDPPWGGDNYKKSENIKLFIGDMTIEDFTIGIFNGMFLIGIPKLLVIKLPKNYDYLHFCKIVGNKELKIIKHQLAKINLLIVIDIKQFNMIYSN